MCLITSCRTRDIRASVLSAPQEDVQNRAYAAAVVLTIIVLVLSFGGRYMMAHFSKNKV